MRPIRHPALNGLHGRARRTARQRLRRRQNINAGLTAKGTDRIQKFRPELAYLRREGRLLEHKRLYNRQWLQERYQRGLTARGTKRILTLHPEIRRLPVFERNKAYKLLSPRRPSARELAWREFRASMNLNNQNV